MGPPRPFTSPSALNDSSGQKILAWPSVTLEDVTLGADSAMESPISMVSTIVSPSVYMKGANYLFHASLRAVEPLTEDGDIIDSDSGESNDDEGDGGKNDGEDVDYLSKLSQMQTRPLAVQASESHPYIMQPQESSMEQFSGIQETEGHSATHLDYSTTSSYSHVFDTEDDYNISPQKERGNNRLQEMSAYVDDLSLLKEEALMDAVTSPHFERQLHSIAEYFEGNASPLPDSFLSKEIRVLLRVALQFFTILSRSIANTASDPYSVIHRSSANHVYEMLTARTNVHLKNVAFGLLSRLKTPDFDQLETGISLTEELTNVLAEAATCIRSVFKVAKSQVNYYSRSLITFCL